MTAPDAAGALAVRLDEHWAELPVHGGQDPSSGGGFVPELMARRRVREPEAVVRLYAQSWAVALERVRARAADADDHLAAAYALLSREDLLPVALTELWVLARAPELDVVVAGTVPDGCARFGEPVLSEVRAPYGVGSRVQQYVVSPEDADPQVVQTSVVHLWPAPVEGAAVLLSTWFGSYVDGELYEPVLEALAGSLAPA